MKASVPRRIDILERYTYENLIPVSQVLDFLEATIALFRACEATTPGAHNVALMVEWFTNPLRAGDVAELQRRHGEWQQLDDAQRLQLLWKEGGNELTNAHQET